jgi:predicted permease
VYLGQIILNIILPIALLAATGYVAARRFHIDVSTLSKLAIYVFIPAIIFDSLSKSEIAGRALLVAALFTFVNTFILTGLGLGAARLLRLDRPLANALAISLGFYNSANFGIPVMSMVLGADGVAIQTAVVTTQSMLMYSWGVFLAAGGRLRKRDALVETVKLPVLYALILGLIIRYTHTAVPPPVETAIGHLARAMVPLALITLGAQVANSCRDQHRLAVATSVVLRLVGGPAMGLGLVTLLGLHGLPAQVLLIGSAAPTAVNSVVLAIEYKNEPDFAVDTVSICTLLSGLTVTAVIFLAKRYM